MTQGLSIHMSRPHVHTVTICILRALKVLKSKSAGHVLANLLAAAPPVLAYDQKNLLPQLRHDSLQIQHAETVAPEWCGHASHRYSQRNMLPCCQLLLHMQASPARRDSHDQTLQLAAQSGASSPEAFNACNRVQWPASCVAIRHMTLLRLLLRICGLQHDVLLCCHLAQCGNSRFILKGFALVW